MSLAPDTVQGAAALAAVATVVGLVVTALWRRAARGARIFGGHVANLSRLPDSLDELRGSLVIFDRRISHIERHLGVNPA